MENTIRKVGGEQYVFDTVELVSNIEKTYQFVNKITMMTNQSKTHVMFILKFLTNHQHWNLE